MNPQLPIQKNHQNVRMNSLGTWERPLAQFIILLNIKKCKVMQYSEINANIDRNFGNFGQMWVV